jgi:hypothetical protein
LDAKFKSEIALFIESYFKTHPEVFKGERGDKGDPLEVDEEELERLVENCMRRMNRRVNWLGGAEPIRRLPAAAVDFAGNVNTVEDLTGSSGSSLVGFTQSGSGTPVARTVAGKFEEKISVFDYIPVAEHAAIRAFTSTTDVTTYIQAAHDACVNEKFSALTWPSGLYTVSAELEFSPFVTHLAEGEVIITTAQASGRGMHISTEFGDRTAGLATGVRKQPVFIGAFHFENSNASTTATAIAFGDLSPSTTYDAHSLAFFGLQLVGWANQADYGYGAYDHVYFGCSFDGTGTSQAANALRIPSTSSSACTAMSYHGCTFANLASVLNILKDPMAVDFHFIGCSMGANLVILKDNSMVQAVVDFSDCHLEINEYSPFASSPMFSVNKATVNVTGGTVFVGNASASYATPVVMDVKNGGRGNIQHVLYQLAENVTTLHACDATSTITVDDIPKYVDGTGTPTNYVSVTAGGVRGSNGIRYVTGTYTPSLTFGGAAVDMTFGARAGDYVRIGRLVMWTATITLTAKGSSTGAAKITGLPFAKGATAGVGNPVSVAYYDTMTGLTSPLFGIVDNGATTVSLFDGGAAAAASVDEGNFNDTTTIQVGGSYFTDAA